MRALLINPQDKTITEVEYNGHYQHINELIDSHAFDIVGLGGVAGSTLFVDDEGLMNGKVHSVGMFRYDGQYPVYLAGKGLILDTGLDGESIATTLSLEDVVKCVSFGEAYLDHEEESAVFKAENGTKYYMDRGE